MARRAGISVVESGLRIELLGGFRVTYGGGPLTGVRSGRQRSLLAYLILHRQHPQPRQRLAFLFWPDSEEAQALTNLRRELHHLRRVVPDIERCLRIDDKVLEWRADAPYEADVREFEEALARAYGDGLQPARDALEEALGLYRGDLLPDCYEEWIVPERDRLRHRCLKALEDLADLLELRRVYGEAIGRVRQLLQLDPLSEGAYRRLMRLLMLSGDRASAVQAYHACATALRRGLDVEPDAETRESYRRLLDLEAAAPPQAPLETAPTLVGRAPEWQRLLAAWHRAAGGRALCAVVHGEAGIGKTRLAEELLAWCAAQHLPIARTRSYAAEGRLAFGPIVEWLRSPAINAAVRRLDAVWLQDLVRLLPELAEAHPGVAVPSLPADGWQRRRLFDAVARGVLAASPILLLLDDLQWCDEDTLEWLGFLLRSHPTARVLVVGTVRTEEQVDNRALAALLLALRQSGQIEDIELGALSDSDTAELAQHVADRRLDPHELAALYHRTQGHPLFVIETVRSGLPLHAPGGSGAEVAVLPAKVQAVIGARLAQLSPAAREVSGIAAAIGRDFRLDLVRDAGTLAEPELVRALDELWRRRILRERADDAYDFSHDRLRDATYAELSPPTRRLLHRRIAQALERLHASDLDGVSAHVAAQYDQAGVHDRAIEWYERAARQATRVCANEEAIRHLRKALALLDQAPETLQRDRQELALQLALTAPLNATSGYATPDMEQSLERARTLAERLGEDEAVLRILWGLCGLHFVRGNIRTETALAEEFHRMAKRLGAFLVESLHVLGGGLASAGAFARARACFDEAMRLQDFGRPRSTLYGTDLRVFLLAWSSHGLWLEGYLDQARERARRAMRVADAIAHPHSQVLARAYGAILFQLARDSAECRLCAEEAHMLSLRYGFAYYGEWGAIIRAWARSADDPSGDAVAEAEQALDRLRAMGAESRRPYFLSLLAEIHARAGRRNVAHAVLDAALATAAANHDVWWSAELHRLKGILGNGMGEPELSKALDVARTQGSKSLELRAAISLADRWIAHGRRDDAQALLGPIHGWFTEGLDTPDLLDAGARLRP